MTALSARETRTWIAAAGLKSWWITEINHGVIDGPTAWAWHKELLGLMEQTDGAGLVENRVFAEACAVGDLERRELAQLCADGAPLEAISTWCLEHENPTWRVWDGLMMISGPPEALFVLARLFPASVTIPRPLGRVSDMVREASETWRHTAEVLVREHGELTCEEMITLVNSVSGHPVSMLEPVERGDSTA